MVFRPNPFASASSNDVASSRKPSRGGGGGGGGGELRKYESVGNSNGKRFAASAKSSQKHPVHEMYVFRIYSNQRHFAALSDDEDDVDDSYDDGCAQFTAAARSS